MKPNLINRLHSIEDFTDSSLKKKQEEVTVSQQEHDEFRSWRAGSTTTALFFKRILTRRNQLLSECMSGASERSETELRTKLAQASILTNLLNNDYENWTTSENA